MRFAELFEGSDGYYIGVLVGSGNYAKIIANNVGPFPTGQAALDRAVQIAHKYEWVQYHQGVGDLTSDERQQIALDPARTHEVDTTDMDDDEFQYGGDSFDMDDYDTISMNNPDEKWGNAAVFHVGDESTILVKDGQIGPTDFNDDFSGFMSKAIGNSPNR